MTNTMTASKRRKALEAKIARLKKLLGECRYYVRQELEATEEGGNDATDELDLLERIAAELEDGSAP